MQMELLCCLTYAIGVVMLPYIWVFFFGNFTFGKVEYCQIIESCGISWEDSVMVEPI